MTTPAHRQTPDELAQRISRLETQLAPHRAWGQCPMTGEEDCCDTLVVELRLLRELEALRATHDTLRGEISSACDTAMRLNIPTRELVGRLRAALSASSPQEPANHANGTASESESNSSSDLHAGKRDDVAGSSRAPYDVSGLAAEPGFKISYEQAVAIGRAAIDAIASPEQEKRDA